MTVLNILQQSTIEGRMVKLPKVVFEFETEYKPVRKALEGIGGVWVAGKNEGFLFINDPAPLLLDLIRNTEKKVIKKNNRLINQDEMNFNSQPIEPFGKSENSMPDEIIQFNLI